MFLEKNESQKILLILIAKYRFRLYFLHLFSQIFIFQYQKITKAV